MFQYQPIDYERLSRWVKASVNLSGGDAFMMPVVQGVGPLDSLLIPADEHFNQLSQKERETIEESMLLTDRFTLSYLWILGAYELIGTLDQRYRENSRSDDHATRTRELRASVNRLATFRTWQLSKRLHGPRFAA